MRLNDYSRRMLIKRCGLITLLKINSTTTRRVASNSSTTHLTQWILLVKETMKLITISSKREDWVKYILMQNSLEMNWDWMTSSKVALVIAISWQRSKLSSISRIESSVYSKVTKIPWTKQVYIEFSYTWTVKSARSLWTIEFLFTKPTRHGLHSVLQTIGLSGRYSWKRHGLKWMVLMQWLLEVYQALQRSTWQEFQIISFLIRNKSRMKPGD